MSKQNQLSVVEVDDVLAEYSLDKLDALTPFKKSCKFAVGMKLMMDAVEPHMDDLMFLKGSKLGFRTDRDTSDKSYSRQQIRDCLIEGMLRGAHPVMNEINIIGGNCYLTKEFFQRRLSELDGFANLHVAFGVPLMKDGGALVEMRATWLWKGQRQSMLCVKTDESDNRIAVRVNAGMGVDAVLGKAESKLLRRIYKKVTGSEWVEEDEVDAVPVLEAEEPEQIEEQDPAEVFAHAIERKFARCFDVDDVEALRGSLIKANEGDQERRDAIMEASRMREADLSE